MNFPNNKDKLGSVLILAFALVYLNSVFAIQVEDSFANEIFSARTFPIFLSVVTIAVCVFQLFLADRGSPDETIADAVAGFRWKPCFLLTGLMLLYGLTFEFFGFFTGTFLFLFAGFAILKEKRFLLSAAVAAGVAAFMWVVLTRMFGIYLDPGDLYRILAGA